jgi:hypothetical protein
MQPPLRLELQQAVERVLVGADELDKAQDQWRFLQRGECTCLRSGTVHALAFWWSLELTEGVTLSTLSGQAVISADGTDARTSTRNEDASSSHWRQAAAIMPDGGVAVEEGDVLSVVALAEGSSVLLQVESVRHQGGERAGTEHRK